MSCSWYPVPVIYRAGGLGGGELPAVGASIALQGAVQLLREGQSMGSREI